MSTDWRNTPYGRRRLRNRRQQTAGRLLNKGITIEQQKAQEPVTLPPTQPAPSNITEVQSSEGQTYTGSVQQLPGGSSVFLGVRPVSEQEQAQAEKDAAFAKAQEEARYNLRSDRSQSREQFNQQLAENKLTPFERGQQIPQGATELFITKTSGTPVNPVVGRFGEGAVTQKAYIMERPKPTIENKKVSPGQSNLSGIESRSEQLLNREKRLADFKDVLYNAAKINRNPQDNWLVSQAKGLTRAPVEVVTLPPFVGGRAAFAGEALFNQEGRQELKRAAGEVPSAMLNMFDPRNPDFAANVILAAIGIKGKASAPPAFISKSFKGYIPIEKSGFQIVESTTQEYSLPEYLGQQNKEVTGIHTSFQDLFKQSEEQPVKAFPEKANKLRKDIGQFSFFKSLPDKATGKPQAYGGYIGIFQDVAGSKPKFQFSFGEPSRYAYIFSNEKIESLSYGEKAAMNKGTAGGRQIMNIQNQQPGKSFLAAENLIGRSIEGQYVSPVGTILKKVPVEGAQKFTIYNQYKFNDPMLKTFSDVTGIGKKSFRLNMVEVESRPGAAEALNFAEEARPDLSPIKSVSVKSAPVSPATMLSKGYVVNSLASSNLNSLVINSPASQSKAASSGSRSKYTATAFSSTSQVSAPIKLFFPAISPSSGSRSSKPSLPSFPSIPSIPSIPSVPSTPSKPSIPSNPSKPSKPSIPSVPSNPVYSNPSKPSAPSYPSFFSSPKKTSYPKTFLYPKKTYKPLFKFKYKAKSSDKGFFQKQSSFMPKINLPTLTAAITNTGTSKANYKRYYLNRTLSGFEFRPIIIEGFTHGKRRKK